MNFDEEDQINQFQRESEMNDNNGQGGDVYDNTSGSEDGDADKDQLLDLEKIKAREGITEKQTSLISKIEGIRRNIQKLIEKKSKLNRQEELAFDDSEFKGKFKGIEKKLKELKGSLEKEEDKQKAREKKKKETQEHISKTISQEIHKEINKPQEPSEEDVKVGETSVVPIVLEPEVQWEIVNLNTIDYLNETPEE